MNGADKQEWKRRAQSALRAPIPHSVRNGSANKAIQYRDDAAMLAAFLRRGSSCSLEHISMAVLRLEGEQRGAQ